MSLARPGRSRQLGLLFVFIAHSLFTGLVFWRETDWWVYVDMTDLGRGMVPKFQIYPVEQFLVSAVVGMTSGGALTGTLLTVGKVWSVLRRDRA